MRLQGGVQEVLVALLCYDKEAGAEAATLVDPADFDPVYRDIVEEAIDYRRQWKGDAPGETTIDLFEKAKAANESRAGHFDLVLASIEDTWSRGVNARFYLDQAATFSRYQRLKDGIEKALRHMTSDDETGLLAAEAAIHESLSQTHSAFDSGFRFADDLSETLRFMTAPEESFPTGIESLDRLGLGPVRGRLHGLLGGTGKGKSWWLVHLSMLSRQRGHRVLYLSLELDKTELGARMVQASLSMTKRPVGEITYERFTKTGDPQDAGTRTRLVSIERPSFAERGAHKSVAKKLRKIQGQGELRVVDYPMHGLSVEELDDFLTALELRERFVPDLLVVDYPGVMKMPKNVEKWQGLVYVCEALRGIAKKRNIAVATVGQLTSSGLKARKVDLEHTGGARDVNNAYDVVLTVSQTEEERRRGLIRIYVAKGRTEEAFFSVLVSQALAAGQFVLDSVRIGSSYFAGDES